MARYAKFFSVGGGAGPNGLQLPLGTVLDTTLRQVQDGLGTNSPLYLSTGSVRIGTTAASAMYWDNTNNRLGIGTSTPIAQLNVVTPYSALNTDFTFSNSDTTNAPSTLSYSSFSSIVRLSKAYGSYRVTNFGGNADVAIFGSGGPAGILQLNQNGGSSNVSLSGEAAGYSHFLTNVGFGLSTTPTAKLQIRGSGSTSATTSLLVQNSAGTELLKVQDDGTTTIRQYVRFLTDGLQVNGFGGGVGGLTLTGTPPNANQIIGAQGLSIVTSTTFNATTGAAMNFGTADIASTSGDISNFLFGGQPNMQSGNASFSQLRLQPNFTTGGTYSGIARGIYYAPSGTLTGVTSHRAIETVSGDVLFGTTSGSVAIGRTSIFNNSALNIEIPITGNAINDRINLYLSSSVTSAGLKFAACNGGSWIQSTQGGNGNTAYRLNLNPFGEGVNVGTLTHLNSSLGIRGAGSTSATTSLLVQNSSGNAALQVKDDLNSVFGQNLQIKGELASGGLTIGDTAYYGAKYVNLISNLPGGGTRGGLRWIDGFGGTTSEIVSDRKQAFSQDVTMCFRVKGTEYITIQEANASSVGTYNVGINNTNPHVSAILDVASTTKGFLPPRVTTIQKNAISSPATGLMVFDTDLVRPCFFNGATWITL